MTTLDLDRMAEALPGYEMGAELGRGAWGVVVRGRHRQLERQVAIKQLPRAFGADPEVRRRFLDEARLLASFDHPHIVPIYDFVEHDGLCLLVMELLDGGSVWDRFVATGLTPEASCGVAVAACCALSYAHEHGILHRDIKPENLVFSSTGALKVTDFGIAKVVGGGKTMATRAGDVLGTPAYMAPEQATGDHVSAATDIYAVGVLAYELLSGRLPYPDDGNAMSVLYRRVHEDPEPLGNVAPAVPSELGSVVMQALARDPLARFADADTFGIAIADAAGRGLGAGWARRGGVPVLAQGPITERLSNGGSSAGASASAPVLGTGDERSGYRARLGTAPDLVAVEQVAPAGDAAVCPLCAGEVYRGDGFCVSCGGAVRWCPDCRSAVARDDRFCQSCGMPA